jgi:hypothetical protein
VRPSTLPSPTSLAKAIIMDTARRHPRKPRWGGLTIEETLDNQDAARKAWGNCRNETREGRKGDGS